MVGNKNPHKIENLYLKLNSSSKNNEILFKIIEDINTNTAKIKRKGQDFKNHFFLLKNNKTKYNKSIIQLNIRAVQEKIIYYPKQIPFYLTST